MNTHFALLLFMPLTLKPPGLAEQQLAETHRNQSNHFSSTAICAPVPLSCMRIRSISSGVDDCLHVMEGFLPAVLIWVQIRYQSRVL